MSITSAARVFLLLTFPVIALSACTEESSSTSKTVTSDARNGAISEVGRMHDGRSGHTATLLKDGRVLIAGGMSDNQRWLKSAELFDPANGKFTAIEDMPRVHLSPAAALLPNGKVLLAGGWADGRNTTDTAEVYDPATQTFGPLAARLAVARTAIAPVTLANGDVLLIGGGRDDTHAVDTVEIFDAAKSTFRVVGHLRHARMLHTASLLNDGRVLVVGGRDESGRVTRSAEIFDPKSGKSEEVSAMAQARYKHTAATLGDGRVLVAGGSDDRDWQGSMNSAEVFDPKTRKFSAVTAMAAKRFKLPREAALLRSGEVLIAGGDASSEVFNPASGRFATVSGAIDGPRHYVTETLLKDGSVLLTGGYANSPEATAKAWIYKQSALSSQQSAAPIHHQ